MSDDGGVVFVADTSGPEGYTAFFEATNTAENEVPAGGYLYISERGGDKIIRHLEIYRCPGPQVKEDDIQIFWSSDGNKCGIVIWGRMRGIVNLTNGQEIGVLLENRNSDGIIDPGWLNGFDTYLDHHRFIRARQRFWKTEAQHYDPEVLPRPAQETPIRTNFIVYDKGPDDLFGVFEDDGASGYLYLYDSKKEEIVEHLHNYDCSQELNVCAEDVEAAWSNDGRKCGVIIWNKMRGIIDRLQPYPGRVWMDDQNSPGIADEEWLRGFEYLRSLSND